MGFNSFSVEDVGERCGMTEVRDLNFGEDDIVFALPSNSDRNTGKVGMGEGCSRDRPSGHVPIHGTAQRAPVVEKPVKRKPEGAYRDCPDCKAVDGVQSYSDGAAFCFICKKAVLGSIPKEPRKEVFVPTPDAIATAMRDHIKKAIHSTNRAYEHAIKLGLKLEFNIVIDAEGLTKLKVRIEEEFS
jgi:hypothetical protein